MQKDIGEKQLPDYLRSLYIAYSSTCVFETQILLTGYLSWAISIKKVMAESQRDIGEIERMLKALIKSLKTNS